MKKNILLIIVSLLNIQSFCQTFNGKQNGQVLINSKFNWNQFNDNISDKSKLQYIKKLFLYQNSNLCDKYGDIDASIEKFSKYHRPKIHFIDLDKDGIHEIIYDGKACSGFESGQVEIFQFTNDSIIQVFSSGGTLIDLNLKNQTITTQRYPCCSENLHFIKQYKYSILNLEFSEATQYKIFSSQKWENNLGPFLPDSLFQPIEITLSDTVKLRWSPNYTDFDIFGCKNNRTNILAEYYTRIKAVIIAKSIDDKWLFVKMENTPSVSHFCIDQRRLKWIGSPNFELYGWIENNRTTYTKTYK